MRRVITAQDLEEMIRAGKTRKDLPEDSILTPGAEELLEQLAGAPGPCAWSPTPPAADPAPAAGPPWIEQDEDPRVLYDAPPNQRRKEELCDIGRRMWAREYVDGNGGNLSIRVAENLALCTPTLVSKGFMRPEQICLVDLDGVQLAGILKRTSEILMHLEIMKAQPRAVACVHGHPPYATAFAAAGVQPPNNILPEYELFIGEVPIAEYVTPGTLDMARAVARLSDQHNTILMANHGVVTWSHLSIEDAYFKMEILEAYCRTIMVTTQLGRAPNRFSPGQMKDLLAIKESLGVPDPRIGLDADRLRADESQWRPGVTCLPGTPRSTDSLVEDVVREVTARILKSRR